MRIGLIGVGSIGGTLAAKFEAIGFEAVDIGDIDRSWRQQPGSPAYCTDLPAPMLRMVVERLAVEDRARLAARRELGLRRMLELPNGIVARDAVPLLRSLAGLEL